jgi:hypothetical protein
MSCSRRRGKAMPNSAVTRKWPITAHLVLIGGIFEFAAF